MSQVHASWQMHQRNIYTGVCSGTNALLYTLGRTLMRHTKAQTVGGQAVSQLPAKSEETLAGPPCHVRGVHPVTSHAAGVP
jgi:hypothetical protein